MAVVNIASVMAVEISVSCSLYRPSFIWCSRVSIQTYLDQASLIKIGLVLNDDNNYDEEDAVRMENGAVNLMVNYLSYSLEITASSDNEELKDLAAMMTAARIGLARFGASMGGEPAAWTANLQNDVWGRLQQIFISQSIAGITAKSVSLTNRLIMAKNRLRTLLNVSA